MGPYKLHKTFAIHLCNDLTKSSEVTIFFALRNSTLPPSRVILVELVPC